MTWTEVNYGTVAGWNLRGGRGGYQARAIDALVENRRGIVVSPAGSGKTIIAARAVEACLLQLLERRRTPYEVFERSLLWLANTTEQVEQARAALSLIPARPGVVLKCRIECVSPALVEALEASDSGPDCLVVDECHHSAAPTWRAAIMAASRSARRAWGFTATDHREDGEWAEVEQLLGPVVCRIDRTEVESGGHRTSAVVRIVSGATAQGEIEAAVNAEVFGDRTDGPPMVERAWNKSKWQIARNNRPAAELRKEIENRCIHQHAMKLGITEHDRRNAAAARIAALHVARGQSVLVLVFSVEQGRAIAEAVPGARLVFSQMRVRVDGRREEIIAGFRDGSVRCLVATSLADEGFDAPRASVLVLAAGGRGISKSEDAAGKRRVSSRLDQRTGRVVRVFEGKAHGFVYDFDDRHHRFLAAQAKSRARGYKALGFDVRTVSVESATGLVCDDGPGMFADPAEAVSP